MGRSRLVVVLHEETWNRSDDLGHLNLTRQVTMLGGWQLLAGHQRSAGTIAATFVVDFAITFPLNRLRNIASLRISGNTFAC
jgi:hypothetical protein